MTTVLEVQGLSVTYRRNAVAAVRDVSFELASGEILAVVGESGCGKSTLARSLTRLTDAQCRISGSIRLGETEITTCDERHLRRIRGSKVATIFQDALAALNPLMRVGLHLSEAIQSHDRRVSDREVRLRSIALLERVGITRPEERLRNYPHELSGGMRQRVLIAMALANDPQLMIADEPTTSLDVTIQAQVLKELEMGRRAAGSALIIVTHDLGIVAEIADRVAVMYAGRFVEVADVSSIFDHPRHPYTAALLAARPGIGQPSSGNLTAIDGAPPPMSSVPPGCSFEPRCPIGHGNAICRSDPPRIETDERSGARFECHFPLPARPEPERRPVSCA